MHFIESNILSLLIIQPLLFAIAIMLFSKGLKHSTRNAWGIGIFSSIITLLLCLKMYFMFDQNAVGFQMMQQHSWIPSWGLQYLLGVDGFSIYFIILTAVLTPICLIFSISSVRTRVTEFIVLFLILQSFVTGVFVALDTFLFYLFFEAVLIPMFLIIGIYGGKDRIYAAFKFFLYTFLGSVLMLVALIYILVVTKSSNVLVLYETLPKLPLHIQNFLFMAFFASFAIKVPMWPFHTWLPDAHVQAPTAGSVILAGILLKLGGYGFLRFSLPMFPDAAQFFSSLMITLGLIAIIYTSIVALMQTDMKKLIAYSSVAHMGYVTAGIFSFNYESLSGAVMQMLSHGIVSAALFLCVGCLYDRMRTKKILEFGGVTNVMPRFALVFMVFMLASVALPGTSGFVGEFTVLVGMFKFNTTFAAFAALGMVLGAAYMLYLYKNVMFGEANAKVAALTDISTGEKICLYSLAILAVFIGIYPRFISAITDNAVLMLEALFN